MRTDMTRKVGLPYSTPRATHLLLEYADRGDRSTGPKMTWFDDAIEAELAYDDALTPCQLFRIIQQAV